MSNQMLPVSGNYDNVRGNVARTKGRLSDRLRGHMDVMSHRARVLAVAGLVLAAIVSPFLGVGQAQARELFADSLIDSSPSVAAAPTRVDPSSRGTARPTLVASEATVATPDISTPAKFIGAVIAPAQDSQAATGVPASVTIAQAILESEWGRSGLSTEAQNYFGIKAIAGPGPAGEISMNTWEVFSGKNTVISDAFKAYHNLYESVIDHGNFLRDNPRYANAFKTTDPKEFARRIHQAGYATDPAYCDKLASLIDKYGLRQYDLPGAGT